MFFNFANTKIDGEISFLSSNEILSLKLESLIAVTFGDSTV